MTKTRQYICSISLLLFFILVHGVALAERKPYFSVSTRRSFSPGEKITLNMYSRDVDAIEFRLYRINDPVRFFEQLDDVHHFGTVPSMGGAKERIDEETWLEKFHDWKMELWHGIRNFFRFQFRHESRVVFRRKQVETVKGTRIISAAQFAQVPLLNSSQLVARWKQEVPTTFFSEQQDLPVDPQKSGVYLVEATDGTLKAYTVVVVSRTALVTKVAEHQMLGFLVDRQSGAPIPGAKVTYWANKKTGTTAETGADGLAEIDTGADHPEQVRIIAVHDDDVAVVSPYSYMFGSNASENWQGYAYTDRPVYRPGHTVHIKAILRKRSGDRRIIPDERNVHIRIIGPDEKQMLDKQGTLSTIGTINTDFEVPAAAPLGYYRVEIGATGNAFASFYVEEYKKPEYQVKVTTDRQRMLQGEPIKATIEARYYFGEPVANAKVTYVVHTSRHYNWDYEFDSESEGDEAYADEGGESGSDYFYDGAQEQEQQGKLDKDGRLIVTIPTRVNEKGKYDLNYRIEARVTDAANREISGYNMVLATYGSFQLSVRAESYLYRVGDTPRIVVTAKDYDDKPVQTPVHLELTRPRWWRNSEKDEVLDKRDVQTGPDGTAIVEWPVKDSGSYRIRATAPSNGRQLEEESYLWIAGANESWWGGERRQVKIVADKKSYRVGDIAKLMVMTGVDHAHVLITSEGRTIQSKQVIEAKGGTTTFEVPITATMQPNVIVNAAFIHDNNLYQGSKDLKVPPEEQRLRLEIQPSKPQFQPGEKATYDVVAKDARGNPVSAEVSVGVVDDAIYAVRPDQSGDILNAFYPRNFRLYNTESSLTFFFTGEAGHKAPLLANSTLSASGRRLAQVKPGSDLVQPKIRKAFPDTAFWAPTVTTDSSGHARVSLEFPDSLTTWRTTVRAITADTKVGSDINRVVVRKNLMVRLAVPRFFRQGDEVTVSTIVHNYLQNTKTARISLDVKGLELVGDNLTRDLTIPSRGEAKVDWRVRATKIGNATLVTKALTNEESDAMELTLPVNAYGVRQAIAHSGSIAMDTGSQKANFQFPQSDPNSHSIGVSLSPSIAGSIFSALQYLTHYPYGCTEQTMSSFLPDVIVAQTLKQLNLKSEVNPVELTKMIRAGTDRLYDYQHDDGGWGWWKEDESQVFMTAYVVAGLSQARDAGYDVRPDAIQRGQSWLKAQLREHPNMVADLQAYVTYALVLSGEREHALLDALWDKKSKLTAQGLAHAGLALHIAGDTRAEEAANDLERQAVQDDTLAYWPAKNDYLLDIEGTDDSAESTANALKLLSLRHPDSPLLPKAAEWLVVHRNEGYWWDSTKQTATVIFGLTDYVKVSHELNANFTAEVLLNGKSIGSRKFTAADFSSAPVDLHVDSTQLNNGANDIEVRKSGGGRLYWSARANYFSTEKKTYQSGSLNLNIVRDYYRLRQERTDEKIVYALDPLNGAVETGDVIAVHVMVSGGDWRYLLVEDPIPAGTEFIERDDLYELKDKPRWWSYGWSRREFHDDRAAFFESYFHNKRDYYYLLKVVNPGVFQVSPALVQPMYQPSVTATTDSIKVEVK